MHPSWMMLVGSVISLASCSHLTHGKVMRNNLLLSKLMSDFHRENLPARSQASDPGDIVTAMQGVLCHNFPSIPCSIIKMDKELTKLIYKSVSQLGQARRSVVKHMKHDPVMPFLNSEELSFYQEGNGYFKEGRKQKRKKASRSIGRDKHTSYWYHESPKNKTFLAPSAGRRKGRTFYPHKTKYKEKRGNSRETAEKFSLSNEMPVFVPPEAQRSNRHSDDKVDDSSEVKWRIDYGRHGSPSSNSYSVLDQLKEKLLQRANFGGDDNLLEATHSHETRQKQLKHPDLYIKKNMKKHYLQVLD